MFYGVLQEASIEEKQRKHILEILNKEYLPKLEKIAKQEIKKFPKLNKCAEYIGSYNFDIAEFHNSTSVFRINEKSAACKTDSTDKSVFPLYCDTNVNEYLIRQRYLCKNAKKIHSYRS